MTRAAQPTPRWKLRRAFAHQERLPNLPPVVGTVLAARGITTRERAERFYKPHLEARHDPLLLPGMEPALRRTREAIEAREPIALFGDFDVDGVTSIALLKLALERLGAVTIPYLPDRFREGYGLNVGAVDELREAGAGLLISADCGTSSVAEVAHANSLGMDAIVLDHHTVPSELPAALAVINPKREGSPYPFTELAAVGVSYRFLQALYESLGRELPERDFLDLVALGTVVDVAPLEDENRAIVSSGLGFMRESPRPGVEALASIAGTSADRIRSETLGFGLGPRLNAAGRMKHARTALDLLLAPTPLAARQIAEELDVLNRQRQAECEQGLLEAEALLGASDDPLTMVGSERMHAGIIGIIAGRLVEARSCPAIVYEQGPETSRASARTFGDFDIVKAIRKESDLLVRHGGHRAAAGFTIRNEHLDLFKDRIVNTAAEQLAPEDLRPSVTIDAEASLADLSGVEIRGLTQFEPCGHGNRRPVLLSRNVELRDARQVGADGSHLKLKVREGASTWPGIAFRMGEAELADEIDIVYSLSREWRGDRMELEVLDFAPSAEARPLDRLGG
ncbi:MAG: single-stranded-DNA-specific exonuclease RecJ [Chloroflexota bacterium]|nr:single-stranded-DNA-specific exonuclease RecJ [Chloroflexota bacterium]